VYGFKLEGNSCQYLVMWKSPKALKSDRFKGLKRINDWVRTQFYAVFDPSSSVPVAISSFPPNIFRPGPQPWRLLSENRRRQPESIAKDIEKNSEPPRVQIQPIFFDDFGVLCIFQIGICFFRYISLTIVSLTALKWMPPVRSVHMHRETWVHN
jgi:hypothetical protein